MRDSDLPGLTPEQILTLAAAPVTEWPPVMRDCWERALRSVPAPEINSGEPVRRFWAVGFLQGAVWGYAWGGE